MPLLRRYISFAIWHAYHLDLPQGSQIIRAWDGAWRYVFDEGSAQSRVEFNGEAGVAANYGVGSASFQTSFGLRGSTSVSFVAHDYRMYLFFSPQTSRPSIEFDPLPDADTLRGVFFGLATSFVVPPSATPLSPSTVDYTLQFALPGVPPAICDAAAGWSIVDNDPSESFRLSNVIYDLPTGVSLPGVRPTWRRASPVEQSECVFSVTARSRVLDPTLGGDRPVRFTLRAANESVAREAGMSSLELPVTLSVPMRNYPRQQVIESPVRSLFSTVGVGRYMNRWSTPLIILDDPSGAPVGTVDYGSTLVASTPCVLTNCGTPGPDRHASCNLIQNGRSVNLNIDYTYRAATPPDLNIVDQCEVRSTFIFRNMAGMAGLRTQLVVPVSVPVGIPASP